MYGRKNLRRQGMDSNAKNYPATRKQMEAVDRIIQYWSIIGKDECDCDLCKHEEGEEPFYERSMWHADKWIKAHKTSNYDRNFWKDERSWTINEPPK